MKEYKALARLRRRRWEAVTIYLALREANAPGYARRAASALLRESSIAYTDALIAAEHARWGKCRRCVVKRLKSAPRGQKRAYPRGGRCHG